ncbi:MAG: YiiX/YebB-like N1pC/P60 family cysteine hydrolase [Myxococcales bacterium]|jgi:hypothetical protein
MFASLLALQITLAAAPAVPEASQVFALPEAQFLEAVREDLRALRLFADGLDRIQSQLAPHAALFKNEDRLFTPDEKRVLLSTWAAIYDYVFSIEEIRRRYWDFVKLPHKRSQHVWGFVLTHAALTTELAHGLAFADAAAGQKQLEVLLDEPSPELGIPNGAFADFKLKVIHVSTATQLFTGDEYRKQILGAMKELGVLDSPDGLWALQQMHKSSEAARKILQKRGIKLFATNALDILADSAMEGFFPVQKNVAEWMGDTRVHRKGKPLISREQALGLLERMEPGDIIVARQNWYLSNVGLPGFWPHAEIYLGTPEELAACFDADPEVQAFVSAIGGTKKLSAYLAARFPEKWKAYQGRDAHGDPLRIIESISEGVSFTGIEHGMRVDYLGVMRPRLSKAAKAQAIVRAFEYQGRPYDFNFDFFSDSTLVCTELVYKSYAPATGKNGLRIELVDVAGRKTLPANLLVQLFDSEFGREDRQLDFVAFLDGREKTRSAVEGDAEAFRVSWKRVKWDIALK